jgi:hypothetical protein
VVYLKNSATNYILNSYYQGFAENEPKFMTAQNGVQNNPDSPPAKKELHTIEPPEVSTQHF